MKLKSLLDLLSRSLIWNIVNLSHKKKIKISIFLQTNNVCFVQNVYITRTDVISI